MRVLIAIPSIQVGTGGPAYNIAGLTSAMVPFGVKFKLVCQSFPQFGPDVFLGQNVEIYKFKSHWPHRYAPNRKLAISIQELSSTVDLIHNQGMWMAINRYATQSATKNRKPIVCSTNGMLESMALKRSYIVKSLAYLAWVRRDLSKTTCFHATSEKEGISIQRMGFTRQPIAISPNGVDIPHPTEIADRKELERKWSWLEGGRYILFLGRIHPFKNPELLVSAWARCLVRKERDMLVLAGPDVGEHTKKVMKIVSYLGLQDKVRLIGPVEGRIKLGLLRHAEALVLPSKSENFGIVVAESLACGTPVIANKNAPWGIIEERMCGWWIQPGEDSLARALMEAFSLPVEERVQIGRRCRELAFEDFSWSRVAEKMNAIYEFALEGNPRPSCILRESRSHLEQ